MSQPPRYQLRIWRGEKHELLNLESEIKNRITDTLEELAETRSPTNHGHCEQLAGTDLLKVKVADYRAIVRHSPPYLDVLVVRHRSVAYRYLETAERRANAGERPIPA